MRSKGLKWLLLAASSIFIVTCASYKPLRVLAPETFGLICTSDDLCVETPDDIAQAATMRADALRFVNDTIAPIQKPPRILFCSSQACTAHFGYPQVAALYVWGTKTLVINDSRWDDYILRHELIHHLQAEHFGTLRSHMLPRWYIEGMAYALSEDPRQPLPRADIQEWRTQFDTWIAAGNDWRHPPR